MRLPKNETTELNPQTAFEQAPFIQLPTAEDFSLTNSAAGLQVAEIFVAAHSTLSLMLS